MYFSLFDPVSLASSQASLDAGTPLSADGVLQLSKMDADNWPVEGIERELLLQVVQTPALRDEQNRPLEAFINQPNSSVAGRTLSLDLDPVALGWESSNFIGWS